MEERDHIRVLHQPGREIADQGALRQDPPGQTCGESELGRMLELARARVQVQIDPADHLAIAQHVIGRDILVPHRDVRSVLIGDPEEPAGDLQQAGAHGREVEIAANLLGIDVIGLAAHPLGIEGGVGRGQRTAGGIIALGPGQEHPDIAPPGSLGESCDLVDELGNRRARPDHLDLRVIGGPIGIPQQLGHLVAQVEDLVQHRVIRGPAPVQEGRMQFLPRRCVAREGREREQIGIVGRDAHESVGVRRVRRDVVLGQAVEPVCGDLDAAHVVANMPPEVLTQHG